MKYLRAFIAGIVVPTILVPIGLYTAAEVGKTELLQIPFLHLLPILWGIWNVLYFALFKRILPIDINLRLIITGAVLGLIIAIYGVFWEHIPSRLGFPSQYQYYPLLALPIIYAILWWLFVKPLNDLLGIKEN